MKNIKLSDYKRGSLQYRYNKNHFIHNIEHDYQLVLVKEEHFVKTNTLLERHYKVIADYDVTWSQKNIVRNLQRLAIPDDAYSLNKAKGELCLKVILFEVESPQYKLTPAGTYYLDWQEVFCNDNLPDIILASQNIETFFNYITLLIGLDNIQQLLSGDLASEGEGKASIQIVDLAGSEGWKSFPEMIAVANNCSDWLVMRNAEFLPDDFWGNDKDIDILCRNLDDYLNAVNATKKGKGISNFEVVIESQKIDVDARYIGDDYYDRLWQENMLIHKDYKGIVPLLNLEDYFFSLLYHARIHKGVVKPVYVPRLHALASSLGFIMNDDILSDDKLCASFIDTYFITKGYKFTYPHDFACYENINRNVTQYVEQRKPMRFNFYFECRLLKTKLFLLACKLLPRTLKDNFKRVLNK